MKKLVCMLGTCIIGLLLLLAVMPSDSAKALTPPRFSPTPRADYFEKSYNTTAEFLQWFKSGEARLQDNGAFIKLLDVYFNYGHMLVPYFEGGSTGFSVECNTDAVLRYWNTVPEYYLDTHYVDNSDVIKYKFCGISQYVKDRDNVTDFDQEKVVNINEPGYPIDKYLYAEKPLAIGGTQTPCVTIRRLSYSPYGSQDTVIGSTYSIEFFYDSILVRVTYRKENDENSVINSLKTLKFTKEVLDLENSKKTAEAIKNTSLRPSNNPDIFLATTVPPSTPPTSVTPAPTSAPGTVKNASKNADKSANIRIVGKKSIKCGKSYKYSAKLNGISGKVKWLVSNKKLARVSKTGKLKALKRGKVKLTAKAGRYKCYVKITIS